MPKVHKCADEKQVMCALSAKDFQQCFAGVKKMCDNVRLVKVLPRVLHTFQPPKFASEFKQLFEWLKANTDDCFQQRIHMVLVRSLCAISTAANKRPLRDAIEIMESCIDAHIDSLKPQSTHCTVPTIVRNRTLTDLLECCHRIDDCRSGLQVYRCLRKAPHLSPTVLDVCILMSLISTETTADPMEDTTVATDKVTIESDCDLSAELRQKTMAELRSDLLSCETRLFADECFAYFRQFANKKGAVLAEFAAAELDGTLTIDRDFERKFGSSDAKEEMGSKKTIAAEKATVFTTDLLCDGLDMDLEEETDAAETGLRIPQLVLSESQVSTLISELRSLQSTGRTAVTSLSGGSLTKADAKYARFVKQMEGDGGAQVLLDGANIGHSIRQGAFSYFLINDVANYFRNVEKRKVRVVLSESRMHKMRFAANPRLKALAKEWKADGLVYEVSPILYDDALWLHAALHSSLKYGFDNVLIVSNDTMRDHKYASKSHRALADFLDTTLCRTQLTSKVDRCGNFTDIVDYDSQPIGWNGPFHYGANGDEAQNDAFDVGLDGILDSKLAVAKRKRSRTEMETDSTGKVRSAESRDDCEDMTELFSTGAKKRKLKSERSVLEVAKSTSAVDFQYSSALPMDNSTQKYDKAYHYSLQQLSWSLPFRPCKPCQFTVRPHFVDVDSTTRLWFIPRHSPTSDLLKKDDTSLLLTPKGFVTGRKLLSRVRWFVAKVHI